MNPAPASTAVLSPAGEVLALRAVAAILSHERESPNPQNEPRGDAERLRAALENVLRGPGPFHPGRDQASRRSVAGARQVQTLGEVAGSIDFGSEIGRGGEHIVFRRRDDRDVRKLTLPEVYGYRFVLDVDGGMIWLRPAIASEYLGRMGLMDAVFGVAVQVVGVVKNPHGWPQIATGQPWIDGAIPDAGETAEWLAEQGFYAMAREFQDRGSVPAGSAWYRPADNVLLGDAVPRNFIKTPEGIIVPIDVSLTLLPQASLPANVLTGLTP